MAVSSPARGGSIRPYSSMSVMTSHSRTVVLPPMVGGGRYGPLNSAPRRRLSATSLWPFRTWTARGNDDGVSRDGERRVGRSRQFLGKTRAPVARLKATNLPLTRVVNTRLLEIVIAPTGSVSTFVLHSMAPVVAFSARTAPLAFAAEGGAPFT